MTVYLYLLDCDRNQRVSLPLALVILASYMPKVIMLPKYPFQSADVKIRLLKEIGYNTQNVGKKRFRDNDIALFNCI